jgi:hypothetical protein
VTPQKDLENISDAFVAELKKKYLTGQKEHQTKLWTGSALWFANELRNEIVDSVSYSHHLVKQLEAITSLATMMENEEVSLRDAASILKCLAGNTPPRKHKVTSND